MTKFVTKSAVRAVVALLILLAFAVVGLPLSVLLPGLFLDGVIFAYKLEPYDQVPRWAIFVLDWMPYVILLAMPIVGGLLGHKLQSWMGALKQKNGIPNNRVEDNSANAPNPQHGRSELK